MGTRGLETLVVGLDAGCHDLVGPLLDDGVLPALAGLVDAGVDARLRSQIPPWTPSAWPSVYTGVNPGKHGVFGFLSFDGYEPGLVDATHVRERTLWELLDRRGLTSVVVNAPVTHPPPAVSGAVVPGYLAPEDPDCHPEGLLAELRDAVGEYRVYPPSKGEEADDERVLAELVDLAASRGAAFRYLHDRFDPDFGFLQYQVTDTVVHEFPGERDPLERVYRTVDESLGAVLDDCDPSTVLVVSDHGIGPCDGRFAPNAWLRERGYVEPTRGAGGMPTWTSLRGWDDDGDPSALDRATRALARAGVTTQRVGATLERVGLRDAALRVVPDGLVRAGSERVDFPASRAYARSRVECGVRINLAGREPSGVVPPDEYEAVRDRLIEGLSAVERPGGGPVFERVARAEEVYEGPYVEETVDVVTVPAGFEVSLTTWLLDDPFDHPTGATWGHHRDGMLVAAGEGVEAGAGAGDPDLFDVAPTALATLGVPASDRMDGAPLPFVDHPGTASYPPVERAAEATDDERVAERLSDLGYLE